MTTTVAQLKTSVKRLFNDIPDDAFLELLNVVHADILSKIRIKPTTQVDVTFPDTSGLYTLSDTVLRIWSATYYESSTLYRELEETSYDKLDYSEEGWRESEAGDPWCFYEIGGKVGLHAKPRSATSGGYPFLRLYCTESETLNSGSSLPTPAKHAQAWKDGVCLKWAEEKYRDQVPHFHTMYYGDGREVTGSFHDLADYVFGRLPREKPTVRTNIRPLRLT